MVHGQAFKVASSAIPHEPLMWQKTIKLFVMERKAIRCPAALCAALRSWYGTSSIADHSSSSGSCFLPVLCSCTPGPFLCVTRRGQGTWPSSYHGTGRGNMSELLLGAEEPSRFPLPPSGGQEEASAEDLQSSSSSLGAPRSFCIRIVGLGDRDLPRCQPAKGVRGCAIPGGSLSGHGATGTFVSEESPSWC